jgi:putative membrane protein
VHHSGYIGEPSRTVSMEVLRVASLWLAIYFGVMVWSAINPHDYFTWFLEVAPALLGVLVLWATRRSFPLTTLAYSLVLFHCIVLMIGGHYTYAEVPLFNTLEDVFGWTRNHYDRLGHLTQGFVPAVLARAPDVRVLLVGGGPQDTALKAQAQALGIADKVVAACCTCRRH